MKRWVFILSVFVFVGCGGSPSSPPTTTPPPVTGPVEPPPEPGPTPNPDPDPAPHPGPGPESNPGPGPAAPPTAVNDQAIVRQNSTANSIDVLRNDLPGDGGALSLVSIVPGLGDAQVAQNQAEYTPMPGFIGAETLSYLAVNPAGYQVSADLEVVVIGETGATLKMAWELDNTAEVTQYLVSQRNIAAPFLETITAFDNDGRQQIFLNITSSGEYAFKVAVVDSGGERSDWSETVKQVITF